MSKPKYYITTPIYYPNAKPHLGTLYSTLLADIFARWHTQMGEESFFLTGLDEHGGKIAEAAAAQNMDTQSFVDKMSLPFVERWREYQLNYSKFIRTSSEQHKKAVAKFIESMIEKGDIYKDTYDEYYCQSCERQIGTEDLKKDEDIACPQCERTSSVKKIKEENYFFRLAKYQEQLLEFYEKNPDFITPQNRMNEVVSFVKSGLKDLSITRTTVKWGIPFPKDEEHTIYVWGDALANYISAIGYGDESQKQHFADLWPANIHVMAKDIVRFHAVYWPAFLMSAGLPLPKKLLVHGYILVNNQKMSKSLGNAIDPQELQQKFGSDAIRYYLAKQMAVGHDGSFDQEELVRCYNADLANNFGNLISRICTLASKNGLEKINPITETEDAEIKKVLTHAENAIREFAGFMNQYQAHQAVAEIMNLCSSVNSLIHNTEPWKLIKTDAEKFYKIISVCAQVTNLAAQMLRSFIPQKMEVALKIFGAENTEFNFAPNQEWQTTLNLQQPKECLFPRIELKALEKEECKKQKPQENVETKEVKDESISFEDFLKVKLAVGQIKVAEPVEKSDKLLRLEVDFGSLGQRQVLSGIAKHYSPEELVGIKAIFITNLAPRKIMGMDSQAMILAGNDKENFSITQPKNINLEPGTLLG